MGKKQHQKDKLYLTTTEWKNTYGGFKGSQNAAALRDKFRRLPFTCCSLSMQPFENPLCTNEGIIFDLMSIVPFLKKYGINPTTGEKMSAKQLIHLKFHKNFEGKYHCPVTFKIFNENTHMVAIKTSGNVFSYEVVERLNFKTGHLRDLLTDEPFTRKDIITIQDPTNLDKFNISCFYHIKHGLKVVDEDEIEAKKDPKHNLKYVNAETRDVLDALDREYKPAVKKEDVKQVADKFNAAHYSTGTVAASFTSTAISPRNTTCNRSIIDEDIIRYERVKKKGYVRLSTNYGNLNLELHCEMVPKVCENFIKHCANGYYNGTVFHRSIKNFMIQGGDPTGTGSGGESVWGAPFKDHFKPNLTHSGRGVLSMANSGPDTNKSQFFITFRSAGHLDGKHTVFGKVVGGLETLDAMEAVETGKNDKPKRDIRLETATVFVNPYEEADEQLANERQEEIIKHDGLKKEEKKKKKIEKKVETPKVVRQGVGKYIQKSRSHGTNEDEDLSETARKKAKLTCRTLSDFSSW
ncbi:hypothetical protein ScPMuIL_006656 [Solemya velum]